MKLENLKPAKGATHNSKRLGRGQGSGKGGTSTRGTKGAQARAGYEHKFGFTNPTRIEFRAVNVSDVQALADQLGKAEIGIEDIKAAGLADNKELVKVLGNGEINAAVNVTADAFSASAASKIEAAGGKATVIGK